MVSVLSATLQRSIGWFLTGSALSFASALMPLYIYNWAFAWEALSRINTNLTVPLFPSIFAVIPLCAVLFLISRIMRSDRALRDQQVSVGLFLAGLATGVLAAFALLFFTLEST